MKPLARGVLTRAWSGVGPNHSADQSPLLSFNGGVPGGNAHGQFARNRFPCTHPRRTSVDSKSSARVAPPVGAGATAFATTHWSLIVRAGDSRAEGGEAALQELCRLYWYPLYAFARRRGLTPADAEDLTQSFLADLLARGAVAKADANRGRFRTFLLTAFENFHSHERERAGALKRGGGQTIASLQAIQEAEARLHDEPATTESPEKIFDRKWAMSLIEAALAAIRHEYDGLGRAVLFDKLHGVLWRGEHQVGYRELARELGSTEGACKMAVHRLRQRVGEQLRTEVARTVAEPAVVEDELRHLLAAVTA